MPVNEKVNAFLDGIKMNSSLCIIESKIYEMTLLFYKKFSKKESIIFLTRLHFTKLSVKLVYSFQCKHTIDFNKIQR